MAWACYHHSGLCVSFHKINFTGAVKRNILTTAKILIDAGIRVDIRDQNGNTPLLSIKNLIMEPNCPISEVSDLVTLLVVNHHASIDALNTEGRSLLTYSVEAGDRFLVLTRLLINLGAKTHSDQLENEAASSAFAWFLRAQMQKPIGQDLDEESLYVLGAAIIAEAHEFGLRTIIDRTMVTLGTSPEVHGPLFRRLHGLLTLYWGQPLQLRQLAVFSIRRSLGPKRLFKGHKNMMSQLKVPEKLQCYITLEEKVLASK